MIRGSKVRILVDQNTGTLVSEFRIIIWLKFPPYLAGVYLIFPDYKTKAGSALFSVTSLSVSRIRLPLLL